MFPIINIVYITYIAKLYHQCHNIMVSLKEYTENISHQAGFNFINSKGSIVH